MDKLKEEHKDVVGVWYRVYIEVLFKGKYENKEYEIHIFRPTNAHKDDAAHDELPYITSVKESQAKECQKAIEEIKSQKEEEEKKEDASDGGKFDIKKITSEDKPKHDGDTFDLKKLTTKADPNNPDPINPDPNNPDPNNHGCTGPNCPHKDEITEKIPLSKLHSINDINLLSVKPVDLPNLTKSLSNLV